MHRYNRIAGPIIDNHHNTLLAIIFYLKTIRNYRSQWLSRNNRTDCDCNIENHHSLTMVVICRPLLLPKADVKQSNQRFWQIKCLQSVLISPKTII